MSGRHRAGEKPRPGRAPGAGALALRQVRADPWVSLLLALLVAVASFLATVGPRLVVDLNSRQVDYTVRELSVLQRDVRSGVVIPPARFDISESGATFASAEQTWAPLTDGLERVRTTQPEPLRSLLQPARFYVDVDPLRQAPDDPDSDIAQIELQYRVDPLLPDLVRLVEGDWPSSTLPLFDILIGGPDGPQTPAGDDLEILLSADAAQQLQWKVGEVRDVPAAAPTRLAGIYTPLDPDDPYWAHSPYGAELAVFDDLDRGKLATAAAYLAPGNPGVVTPGSTREVRIWYPLDASDVPGGDVGALTAQLGALTAGQVTVIDEPAPERGEGTAGPPPEPGVEARFVTEIFGVLRELSTQQRATASILAVVASGPVGVALAVFALGARLIVTRRRATLALASARGGSDRQVRGVLAAEGAVLGLPAAALGYVVAGLVVSPLTSWPWPALVLAGCIALVPAAVLALGPSVPSLREARSDLGSRGRQARVRWVAEIVVVGLAAVALWRLLDRGLTGVTLPDADTAGGAGTAAGDPSGLAPAASVDTGVDLLMAGTPVLLALAAAVLTLRLYPVPLRALTRVLRSRTSLPPFLGAARSLRDPAGGLVPALAMILGIAVAATSALLASTITDGAERAVWTGNGAQIRLSGPRVTEELVTTLTGVQGVAEVARVAEASRTVNVTGVQASTRSVTVYLVDETLAGVQAAAPLLPALPEQLYADGSPLWVLTGGGLTQASGEVTVNSAGTARVAGHVDELPGVRTDGQFLVVARPAWEAAGGTAALGNLALLSVDGDADRDLVAQAVARAVPNSRVETPQARLEEFRAEPVTSGLTRAFGVTVPLTTGLTVLAVLLVQAIGSPSRVRLLAVLRTLGASRRQSRALTGWELAPMLTAAFVVGSLLGVAIPWLLLRAVDLRGLTGSATQPALSIDPAALGLVVLGVLLTVVLAVIVSAAIAARTDLAQHLRLGEER